MELTHTSMPPPGQASGRHCVEQGVRDKPTLRSELATVTQPSQVSLPTSPIARAHKGVLLISVPSASIGHNAT
jgi:hypothetical protein